MHWHNARAKLPIRGHSIANPPTLFQSSTNLRIHHNSTNTLLYQINCQNTNIIHNQLICLSSKTIQCKANLTIFDQSDNQMPIGDQVDVTELTTVEAVLIQLFPIYYPPPSSHPIHPSIAYLDWHQLTLNRYALALVMPTLNSCHYKLQEHQHSISLNISIYILQYSKLDWHRSTCIGTGHANLLPIGGHSRK